MFKIGDRLQGIYTPFNTVMAEYEVVDVRLDNTYKIQSLIYPDIYYWLDEAYIIKNYRLISGATFLQPKAIPNNCNCDFFSVLLPKGCQCNGR